MPIKSAKNTITGQQFAAYLRLWFSQSGKKQVEASAFLGISQGKLSGILSNRDTPSLAVMEEIAGKLDINLVSMLSEGQELLGQYGSDFYNATAEERSVAFRLWLEQYVRGNNLTYRVAAQKMGVKQETISQILNDGLSPPLEVMKTMLEGVGLKYINTLTPHLLPISDCPIPEDNPAPPYEPSWEEWEEIADQRAIEMLRNSSDSDASEPFPMVKVPVFDAGAWELSAYILNWRDHELSEDDDFIYVTPREKNLGAFGIKVNGDSMAPTIELGDIVICMPTRSIENGKVVLACWPGSEADPGKRLIKRYKADEDGNVLLWSDNPAHKPIALSEKEMREIHLCRVTKLVKDL